MDFIKSIGKKRAVLAKAFMVMLIFFVACKSSDAKEIIDDDYGYTLDLPEGFEMADFTKDGTSYLFAHAMTGTQLVLKISGDTQNSRDCLMSSLSKLGSTYEEIDMFRWQALDCHITKFSMLAQYEGWSLSVPLVRQNSCLVLMCYATNDRAAALQQFMMSCLNSLAIDKESLLEPGPIATYAFPRNKPTPAVLNIGGGKVKTEIDKDDAVAAQFVIDCEWAVLKMYAGAANWKEAWQRYYKAIFRDSAGRTKKSAQAIYTKLMPKAQKIAAQSGEDNADAEKIAFMQFLLSWTQDFKYERNTSVYSADFTPVPSCLMGEGSDCDSRSMLLCAIAENLGLDATLFVSRDYSHALFGLAVAESTPGAKISVNGKSYLLGETTAKVDLGMVAQEFSDTSKWIAVPLN